MKYLKEKRKILASHTSQFFTRHLSQRGFSGYVSFDHNDETLELIVSITNLSCGVKLGKHVGGKLSLGAFDCKIWISDFKIRISNVQKIATSENGF